LSINEIIATGITSFVFAVFSSLATFYLVNICYAKKQAKRKDKMFLFCSLMATRDMMEREWIRSLNLITIVFGDNNNVLTAWQNYHNSLKVEKTEEWTDVKRAEARKLQIKLLEAMANDKDLDYGKITWDVIDDSYYPVWLKTQHERQENEGKMISQGLEAMNMLPSMMSAMSNPPKPYPSGAKKGGRKP